MKEQLYDELKTWGCDIEEAMERFMNDKEFYESCLMTVLSDTNFEQMKGELESGNAKAAFDMAHTLKGVCGNMGLTPMYNFTVELVEPLRAGKCENLMGTYEQLIAAKSKLEDIVRRNS